MKNDNQQALALVNAGADPNTHYEEQLPSVTQLLTSLFHHSALPINDSPTAFRIVCGEFWSGKDTYMFLHRPDSPELAEAMLQHGAQVNGKNLDGWTTLIYAAGNRRPKIVSVLLRHGADVNMHSNRGASALLCAVLDNKTTEITQKLLEYGADPNLPDRNGNTVLQQAERTQRPDLVTLLRKAGAKK